jgi:SAM-dependent methyltransferase
MRLPEAIELIRPAIHTRGGTWADFGAGTGLFTRALTRVLGPSGRIIAVDRDRRALSDLRRLAREPTDGVAEILAVQGDFQSLDSIGELAGVHLDGALFANALHFVPDAGRVLAEGARLLAPGGRLVVVEYDRRPASRWVPYPVSIERLGVLASEAFLEAPRVVGERPSAFGGAMYCAVLARPNRQGSASAGNRQAKIDPPHDATHMMAPRRRR